MCDITIDNIKALFGRLDEICGYLRIEDCRKQIQKLEQQSVEADFWSDTDSAKQTMGKLTSYKATVKSYEQALSFLEDCEVAFEMGTDTDDEALLLEAQDLYSQVEQELTELELASWFDDELDHGDAIITITPGLGGLEAQDWCDMLFHMYLNFCASRKWKTEIMDAPQAEVIGIDRATFRVSGHNAYGMLKAEQGVHRLVRISPTDEKKRRQTTFAGVEVLPVLPSDIEVQIDPKDLKIDVYHASGPGGQGVNTTDSAVRITHLPTGIVVTCQNERSQLQNKACATEILKSKLYELERQKRDEAIDELRGPRKDISFGNQIRSYVLYPYQLIKDLRSGWETGRVEDFLQDGDLNECIVAYHRWRVGEASKGDDSFNK